MRRTRNPVYGYTVSRVRIPPFPPRSTPSACRTWGFSFRPHHGGAVLGPPSGLFRAPQPPETRAEASHSPGEGPWTVRSRRADHATLAWLFDSGQRAPAPKTLPGRTGSGPQLPCRPLRCHASLPHRDAVHVSFGLTASPESLLVSCQRLQPLPRLSRGEPRASAQLSEHAPGSATLDGALPPQFSAPARSGRPDRQRQPAQFAGGLLSGG